MKAPAMARRGTAGAFGIGDKIACRRYPKVGHEELLRNKTSCFWSSSTCLQRVASTIGTDISTRVNWS